MFDRNNRVNFVWHLYALATLGFVLAAFSAVFGVLYLSKYAATLPREHQVFRVRQEYIGDFVPDSLKPVVADMVKHLATNCQIAQEPEDCISMARKTAEYTYEIKTFSYRLQICSVRRNGELHNCTYVESRSPEHIRIRDSLATIAKQANN